MSIATYPVVLLTAKNDLNSKIRGLETGADAYIEKPFSFKYLTTQLNSLLENRKREKEAFIKKPYVTSQSIGLCKADEELINKIIGIIEENITDSNFGVERLSEIINMSRSSLHRKIKALSGTSPTDFIRLIRLKKASELIAEGHYRTRRGVLYRRNKLSLLFYQIVSKTVWYDTEGI